MSALLALLLVSATTKLQVTVWPEGYGSAEVRRYSLSCGPARGTVPRPARACSLLSRLGAAAFAPPPRDSVCTAIWGGPAKARVRGLVGGVAVNARLNLGNGCEIDRWNRLAPVVPRPRS